MHDVPLLINITIALVAAFFGGILARRIGLPTIVGYLLAGILIGPFTPGFVGDVDTIQQLAELGVIFLMFGVGLHFSLSQLWRVRKIAIPGALLQTFLATLAGIGLTRLWGWNLLASIVLGLSISVASTVVLLRGLMDNKLLNTSHGQAAVGWLVMEDILSVLILVFMPALSSTGSAFDWGNLALTLLKAAAFVVIMFLVGTRFIPWLLERVAHTHSRELFILAVLVITLGTAMGAAELFGVSLALGAFVAGAIISQSHLSHQVGADVFSFREAFSVLFFVSIGMLVNPVFLWQNLGQVAALSGMVIIGKMIIVLLMALVFPHPLRTYVIIAIGLSQVGEFSFILGQGGLSLNLLTSNQYSLILAASLISITVNPFMYRLIQPLEKLLARLPGYRNKLRQQSLIPELDEGSLKDHVVIIGYDRVGKHMVDVLTSLKVPLLVIEEDVDRIVELGKRNIPALFGDASNSEVITHAHLEKARVLVSTVTDETAISLIVARARDIAPDLTIVARSTTREGVDELAGLGANYIVQPELEGGLELVHHTLLELGFPLREVHEYAQAVRRDHYNIDITTTDEHRSLDDLLTAFEGIEITWLKLHQDSPLIGKTLAEADIRASSGASVVALIRGGKLTPNPKSNTVFQEGDRLGIIGEEEQIEAARMMICKDAPCKIE
ncbi:MAG: cation:proton antiporter [Anaerolineaceae bacterium]|nr:cation:proton antiporter [Anaerolineaceae bacterium]